MRLSTILLQLAAACAATGCTSSEDSASTCSKNRRDVSLSATDACGILASEDVRYVQRSVFFNSACVAACGADLEVCIFPQEFIDAYTSANQAPQDGGGAPGSGDGGSPSRTCPSSSPVQITCAPDCTGRRTSGVAEPMGIPSSAAAYLATSAYLEDVSVLAFHRLAAELSAHGAPEELIALARRAAEEEVEHAAIIWRLAERFGATDEPARATMAPSGVRSLFDVALENAVEGCVRETYGATVGAVRAAHATDPVVRDAMRTVAMDECGHAELSWRVLAWTLTRLGASERATIARAMRAARDELARDIETEARLSEEDEKLLGMPSVQEKSALLRAVEDRAFFRA